MCWFHYHGADWGSADIKAYSEPVLMVSQSNGYGIMFFRRKKRLVFQPVDYNRVLIGLVGAVS